MRLRLTANIGESGPKNVAHDTVGVAAGRYQFARVHWRVGGFVSAHHGDGFASVGWLARLTDCWRLSITRDEEGVGSTIPGLGSDARLRVCMLSRRGGGLRSKFLEGGTAWNNDHITEVRIVI
jgi:hypothetical protein